MVFSSHLYAKHHSIGFILKLRLLRKQKKKIDEFEQFTQMFDGPNEVDACHCLHLAKKKKKMLK